jgi:hypothetical protein
MPRRLQAARNLRRSNVMTVCPLRKGFVLSQTIPDAARQGLPSFLRQRDEKLGALLFRGRFFLRDHSEAQNQARRDAAVRVHDALHGYVAGLEVGVVEVARDAPGKSARDADVKAGAGCHGKGRTRFERRNHLLIQMRAAHQTMHEERRSPEMRRELRSRKKEITVRIEVGTVVAIVARNISLDTKPSADDRQRNAQRGVPAVGAAAERIGLRVVVGEQEPRVAAIQFEFGRRALVNAILALRPAGAARTGMSRSEKSSFCNMRSPQVCEIKPGQEACRRTELQVREAVIGLNRASS